MPTVRSIPFPSVSEVTSDAGCFAFIYDAQGNRYSGYRFPPPAPFPTGFTVQGLFKEEWDMHVFS